MGLLKGSVRSVAFFMLDKVPAPEMVAATVENIILPFAKEHKIPFDELLLQYIKVKLYKTRLLGTNISFSLCLMASVSSQSDHH